jgi:hypothetical protein
MFLVPLRLVATLPVGDAKPGQAEALPPARIPQVFKHMAIEVTRNGRRGMAVPNRNAYGERGLGS